MKEDVENLVETEMDAADKSLSEAIDILCELIHELPGEEYEKIAEKAIEDLEEIQCDIAALARDLKFYDWDGSQEAYERMKDELWQNR